MLGELELIFAFDFGFAVDLESAAAVIEAGRRHRLLQSPRVPWMKLEMADPPLRGTIERAARLGSLSSKAEVEFAIHDFASAVWTYRFPLEVDGAGLHALSHRLRSDPTVTLRARADMAELIELLGETVEEPRAEASVEDYALFILEPDGEVEAFMADRRGLAAFLRAEDAELADDEVSSALALQTAYRRDERVILDWECGLAVGRDMEAERRLLEVIQVQLVSLRQLDTQLSRGIDRAYGALRDAESGVGRFSLQTGVLTAIGRVDADLTLIHEGIDNALGVLEDVYLARLQRLAKDRFRMDELDRALGRKLAALARIHEKLGDLAAQRRSEVLEWIIILLIALEIALALLRIGS